MEKVRDVGKLIEKISEADGLFDLKLKYRLDSLLVLSYSEIHETNSLSMNFQMKFTSYKNLELENLMKKLKKTIKKELTDNNKIVSHLIYQKFLRKFRSNNAIDYATKESKEAVESRIYLFDLTNDETESVIEEIYDLYLDSKHKHRNENERNRTAVHDNDTVQLMLEMFGNMKLQEIRMNIQRLLTERLLALKKQYPDCYDGKISSNSISFAFKKLVFDSFKEKACDESLKFIKWNQVENKFQIFIHDGELANLFTSATRFVEYMRFLLESKHNPVMFIKTFDPDFYEGIDEGLNILNGDYIDLVVDNNDSRNENNNASNVESKEKQHRKKVGQQPGTSKVAEKKRDNSKNTTERRDSSTSSSSSSEEDWVHRLSAVREEDEVKKKKKILLYYDDDDFKDFVLTERIVDHLQNKHQDRINFQISIGERKYGGFVDCTDEEIKQILKFDMQEERRKRVTNYKRSHMKIYTDRVDERIAQIREEIDNISGYLQVIRMLKSRIHEFDDNATAANDTSNAQNQNSVCPLMIAEKNLLNVELYLNYRRAYKTRLQKYKTLESKLLCRRDSLRSTCDIYKRFKKLLLKCSTELSNDMLALDKDLLFQMLQSYMFASHSIKIQKYINNFFEMYDEIRDNFPDVLAKDTKGFDFKYFNRKT